MNIKYITNVRIPTPRAQGYAIMKMCSEFSRAGAEIELVVPNRKKGKDNCDPFCFYDIERNFRINYLPCTDFLGRFYRFGRIFYWIDILTFFIFAKISIDFGTQDILYTRDYLAVLFFLKNKNIYLELHDMPASKFLLKFVLQTPKLFFVLNQDMKDSLIKMGVSASKINIFPSGVDIEKFDIDISKEEARKRLSQDPTTQKLRGTSKKIILYSGQLYLWKGAKTLAEAARLLPEVDFLFVGGVEPELSAFKNKYGNVGNITVLPFQERSIVPVYLKAADILVLPNSAREQISVRYTSPLKMFEYMTAKRPIIASNLPSIRETLDDKSAIFAEPDNPQSFVEAIKKIFFNKEFAEKIAQNAFKKVTKYSWKERARNILSIINQNIT